MYMYSADESHKYMRLHQLMPVLKCVFYNGHIENCVRAAEILRNLSVNPDIEVRAPAVLTLTLRYMNVNVSCM